MAIFSRREKLMIGAAALIIILGMFLCFGSLETRGEECVVGDHDGSGAVDLDDALHLIEYIYAGGDPPVQCTSDLAFIYDLFRFENARRDTNRGLYWFTFTSRDSIADLYFHANHLSDSTCPKQSRYLAWFSVIPEAVIFVRFHEESIREDYRDLFLQIDLDSVEDTTGIGGGFGITNPGE